MQKKKILAGLSALALMAILAVGCGSSAKQASPAGEKKFVYGTTGYGVDMGDEGLNPHKSYSGWSCVRYGVGETLFKFSDTMEPVPWLATAYKFTNPNTVVITLRDNVTFSSGRKLDGDAVKECLEHLLKVHDRAPLDTKIDKITAQGQTVTIHTKEPTPALINYLCDPYGAIIDMQAGIKADSNVAGTGPYIASAVSDTEITLHKNSNYWGKIKPKIDTIVVKAMTNGDTMTMALQSGELDATYGLPYASYKLFENKKEYNISSIATSRTFFAQMNYHSSLMQDKAVREAIALGINKEAFVKVLLNGHGTPAVGPFPDSFKFGGKMVHGLQYNPAEAKKILAAAGWQDTNGDGYVDKNGENLTIRWLTYPGRMELPILAEAAQATLKDIGIKVEVNSNANHLKEIKKGTFDVYASAMVTAPTGDPEYFFTTCCLAASAKNRGFYHNDNLEKLAQELHTTFDRDKRGQLAAQMQQILLDDRGYLFASHLQMSLVAKSKVKGLVAHPCDYYEITSDLDV